MIKMTATKMGRVKVLLSKLRPVADQAENSTVEQSENCASKQAENGAKVANIERRCSKQRQSVTVTVVVEIYTLISYNVHLLYKINSTLFFNYLL